MSKRWVMVTGATRGLGLAISRALVRSGYFVVGVSRSFSSEFFDLSEEYPESTAFVTHDFSNSNELHSLVKELLASHGPPWGLVNNAAVGLDGILATQHESDIARVLDVNVKAPLILTKYMARGMLRGKGGRIVNVSSIIASTGFSGLAVYAASKAALNGFTKSLARELGKAKITVNSVSPGYMKTDMTTSISPDKLEIIRRRSPLGELVSPEDVARMVLFLLSEDSGSITGGEFIVDAGSTA